LAAAAVEWWEWEWGEWWGWLDLEADKEEEEEDFIAEPGAEGRGLEEGYEEECSLCLSVSTMWRNLQFVEFLHPLAVLKYKQTGIDPTPPPPVPPPAAPVPAAAAATTVDPEVAVVGAAAGVVAGAAEVETEVVEDESFCVAFAVLLLLLLWLCGSSRVSPETNETDETVEEAEGEEPMKSSDWKSCGVDWWKSWRVGGSWVKICPKEGKNSDSNLLSWEDKKDEEAAEEAAPERRDGFKRWVEEDPEVSPPPPPELAAPCPASDPVLWAIIPMPMPQEEEGGRAS
jgi:hypothetical protein